MWPCNCSKADIARQTPRETFTLWQQMAKTAAALSGAGGQTTVEKVAQAVEGPRKKGVQGIGGLGMDKVEEWAAQPGEDDRDPFSIPREIAKKRNYAFALKACAIGHLSGVGVPRENWEACRNWFDQMWATDTAKFQQLEMAFAVPPEQGRQAIIEANRNTRYFERFKIVQGDDYAAGEWFDWVRARKLEREKADAVRSETRPGDAGTGPDPR